MSDVERICEQNYQRVRWAEEYSDMRDPVLQFPSRKEKEKARKRSRHLRTAALTCAAICGSGTTIMAVGINNANAPTIITGGIVVLSFLISGFILDAMAEDGADYV